MANSDATEFSRRPKITRPIVELLTLVDNIKDKLNDGEYLALCNKCKQVHTTVKTLNEISENSEKIVTLQQTLIDQQKNLISLKKRRVEELKSGKDQQLRQTKRKLGDEFSEVGHEELRTHSRRDSLSCP
jgi:Mg2+ and Co2+ transporter CorA